MPYQTEDVVEQFNPNSPPLKSPEKRGQVTTAFEYLAKSLEEGLDLSAKLEGRLKTVLTTYPNKSEAGNGQITGDKPSSGVPLADHLSGLAEKCALLNSQLRSLMDRIEL